ncbi:hypothetical protein L249_3009 [Ophiocordyceps polyrhachis-furcata BCC 54312]|uniref:Uncharacterized protein n=1 Tax=Ophiocordyceps polyrhachis-furcata BCC 54312 TaxID=1330021 RepID=A0A367LN98_9HYPO|nr:hypothetical protein L249_3009 [Ophiocordyceps polyrhachis-furcata BCC 54312]
MCLCTERRILTEVSGEAFATALRERGRQIFLRWHFDLPVFRTASSSSSSSITPSITPIITMGETSSKKRKHDGESSDKDKKKKKQKMKKKVTLDSPPSTASVSSVLRPVQCPPVIGNASFWCPTTAIGVIYGLVVGLTDISASKHTRSKTRRELLLRSSDHATLDYTAREADPRGSKPLLSHFIGVYDPTTGKLDVIEAKKMVVRATVRAAEAAITEEQVAKTFTDRRADLKQTFGTRKVKKMMRQTALNTIDKSTDTAKTQPAMKATLEAIAAATSRMATVEQLKAASEMSRPVPRPNLEAKKVEDAYDVGTMIGTDILNLVPIAEWQEKVRAGEAVETPSRFVSARLNKFAADDSLTEKLRILRYLELALRFYNCTKKQGRQVGRQLPPRAELRQALSPAPEAVVENLRRKFSDGESMLKFHSELLITHCCVLALILDGFQTVTLPLRQDLKIGDDKTMNQFFQEVGAKVKAFRLTVRVVDYRGRVAVITIANEAKLNALTRGQFTELDVRLREVATHDDVIVTVLLARGRYFSSSEFSPISYFSIILFFGADVTSVRNLDNTDGDDDDTSASGLRSRWVADFVAGNLSITHAFATHPKILVVGLNGPVVGLTAALVSFADFIYAVPHAFLLAPFASLGLVAEGGASRAMVRRLGLARANEALLMSKRLTASELEACGFLNAVFPYGVGQDEAFRSRVLQEVDDRLGDHLNGGSLLAIKKQIVGPDMDTLHSQNVHEVFAGLDRLVTGIPQREFRKLANREKRHKL